MNDLEALVSLNIIPQIGSVRLSKLLDVFKKPGAIFTAGHKDLASVLGQEISQSIVSFDYKRLDSDLSSARGSGLKIITILDSEYPKALKEIPGAPIVLYIFGEILLEDSLAVGIVGSRRASFYGLNQSEKFAADLAVHGITVVSGMAKGVDTYAHRGALKVKGRTIAVIGSGFNHIYPEENKDLAKEISFSGAVISEFPMEASPLPQNFPRRNRLISGLSMGVLITEAAKNSGALITADFALEQGKDVFALPGRIDSAMAMGSNALLKQGAKLVTCCEDIFQELNLDTGEKFEMKKPDSLFGEENQVYGFIGSNATSIDDLIEKTSLPSSRILNSVLKLRFKKLIRQLPGKQFVRN